MLGQSTGDGDRQRRLSDPALEVSDRDEFASYAQSVELTEKLTQIR
jgi:hypothetical protein